MIIVVLVDVVFEAFVVEEEEPVGAVRGYLEVQFKKAVGKHEAIPPLADRADPKEGWWWQEGNDPVDEPRGEPAPYSRVHPWTSDDV